MNTENHLDTIIFAPVENLLLPIDAVTRALFPFSKAKLDATISKGKEKFDAQIKEGRAKVKGKRQPVESALRLDCKYPLNLFDKAVLVAVASEYSAGNTTTTINRICKLLGGSRYIGEKFKAAVVNSISKLLLTKLTINTADEVQARYSGKQVTVMTAALLSTETVIRKNGGHIDESAIHILAQSPIITISENKRQIARIPLKVFEGRKSRLTENIVALQIYLLERAATISYSNSDNKSKRAKKLSTTILFDSLYNICEFGKVNRWQRQDIRANVAIILDTFKNNDVISGWEFIKLDGVSNADSYHGIKILPAKNAALEE